jgi:ferrous iron transport protein A
MPLFMLNPGEQTVIKKVGGKKEVKSFLENLGFTTNSAVSIVSRMGGSVVVNVKNSRVALSRDMADKIIV